MLRAYFNYPTSRVTVHRDPTCRFFQKGENPPRRKCLLNARTITRRDCQVLLGGQPSHASYRLRRMVKEGNL